MSPLPIWDVERPNFVQALWMFPELFVLMSAKLFHLQKAAFHSTPLCPLDLTCFQSSLPHIASNDEFRSSTLIMEVSECQPVAAELAQAQRVLSVIRIHFFFVNRFSSSLLTILTTKPSLEEAGT